MTKKPHEIDTVLPPEVQAAFDAYYEPLYDYPTFQQVFKAGWDAGREAATLVVEPVYAIDAHATGSEG